MTPRDLLVILCALSLVAGLSACSDDDARDTGDDMTVDASSSGMDASSSGLDASSSGIDASSSGTDASSSGTDASSSGLDMGGDADTSPPPVGLMTRPANPDCVAPPRAETSGPLVWSVASWGGLGSLQLMMIRQTPDGGWFEIYREGEVYWVDSQGQRSGVLLTINTTTEGEMGLLGFDLHPDWPSTPELFFYYTTLPGDGAIHIDRYTADVSGGGPSIDAASRVEIFTLDRGVPWTNHLGGTIEFDPTSPTPMLYLAHGDAERQDDVQDPTTLFGKLIRIDVSSPPYTPEVVGMGLRNPFRWSFDSQTGDLWIGDVGESDWEEVTFVPAADIPGPGGAPLNFGWPIMEGFSCVSGGDPADSCGHPDPLLLPADAYGRGLGVSVIGGRAYRGRAIVGIDGHYFFNDIFPTGGEPAWVLEPNPDEDPGVLDDDYLRVEIGPGPGGFVGYAEDAEGELYAFTRDGGIFRLEADESGGPPMETMAAALSMTGCFGADGAPGSGLIPYDINAPLWSDGAEKARWLSLPDGETISVDAEGDFDFPPGTILAKEFTQEGVRVETRLFVRHPDGVWAGYSYAWVDENGDPTSDGQLLSDDSVTRSVPGTGVSWTYPSRSQCTSCHTDAAGGSLGLEIGQLNRDMVYPSTGVDANQVYTLEQVGMLDVDLGDFGARALPAYDDESVAAADRAWSYMHSNCANCHQPGGPGFGGRSAMPDMRFDLFHDSGASPHPLAERLCDVQAGAGDLGLGGGALLVEPGAPGDWSDLGAGGSVLYLRMAARPDVPGSTGTMPQLGSARVDDVHGLPLVSEWITNLNCP